MDKKIKQIISDIHETDIAVLKNINLRIKLLKQVKQLRTQEGMVFADPVHDGQIVDLLKQNNTGPLPDNLLEELWNHILTFTKVVVDGKDLKHEGSLVKDE